MHKFRKIVSAGLVVAATALLLAGGKTWAQSAGVGGNGLKVSPVRSDLTINPGATQTITVYVQNVTSGPATLQVLVNDFVAGSNETGQPNLILDPKQSAPAHGLKQFVAPVANVTLQAGEQKQVPVTITVPKTAAGGGYFGAVRFAPASSSSNQNVTLSASVGSLILVKVPGDVREQLSIASFDVRRDDTASSFFTATHYKDKNGAQQPLQAVVRFQNEGNIQLEPFGKITLKKGSTTLATQEINNTDPRGNILPDSIRRFQVPLDKVGSLGKYTVQGNFGYGSSGQLLTASTTFYVVPFGLIAALIVVIVLVILSIVALKRQSRSRIRSKR